MAELYRQVVLKEAKPEVASGLQIQGLGGKKKAEDSEPVQRPVHLAVVR